MRNLLVSLLLLSVNIYAQPNPENKTIQDIALMERLGHQRLSAAAAATAASANFDVKYYRCEWEVDPAVRYIKGKVTLYYVTTFYEGVPPNTGMVFSLRLRMPVPPFFGP